MKLINDGVKLSNFSIIFVLISSLAPCSSSSQSSIRIETADQYPQTIEIEFVKEKADEIQSLSIGSNITVQIDIKGRKWTNPDGLTRVFNTFQGLKYASDF